MRTVVFTDLDGTLLDLETYSAETAAPAVQALQQAGVTIVFCSSKTLAEQEFYLHTLSIRTPVIVENGSAIIWPEDLPLQFPVEYGRLPTAGDPRALVLGAPYKEILAAIHAFAAIFPYPLKYYGNTTAAEVAGITGLDQDAAMRAMARKYSETIFNVSPDDPHLPEFERALDRLGLQCIPGSRYLTITGKGSDKGRAVRALIAAYQIQGMPVRSYGVGDSRNDLEMLQSVDAPRLVARPDGSWADISVPGLKKVPGIGPQGWRMVAEEILDRIAQTRDTRGG